MQLFCIKILFLFKALGREFKYPTEYQRGDEADGEQCCDDTYGSIAKSKSREYGRHHLDNQPGRYHVGGSNANYITAL